MRRSELQGERLHLLRRFLALIALGAFLVPMVLPNRTQAARVQQDAKQDKKDAKQENKETPPPVRQDSNNKDTRFTAEQIVESVILIYGSAPLLLTQEKTPELP